MENAQTCYQLRKRRRVEIELCRTAKPNQSAMPAELSELSSDRAVLFVPAALEIGESVRFYLRCRTPDVELTGEGEIRWVWYTPDGKRRIVCDLTKTFAPELLEALCAAGLTQPRPHSTRRLPVPVQAQWELQRDKVDGTIEAFSRDGFFFHSLQPPRPGGRLMLLLDDGNRKPLQLPARACAQRALRQGYLVECSFESARGYELLGNFIYPPDAPTPAPTPANPVQPTLSTFCQCGIVALLYLAWFAQFAS